MLMFVGSMGACPVTLLSMVHPPPRSPRTPPTVVLQLVIPNIAHLLCGLLLREIRSRGRRRRLSLFDRRTEPREIEAVAAAATSLFRGEIDRRSELREVEPGRLCATAGIFCPAKLGR